MPPANTERINPLDHRIPACSDERDWSSVVLETTMRGFDSRESVVARDGSAFLMTDLDRQGDGRTALAILLSPLRRLRIGDGLHAGL
jgi:hypothetical protein